MKHSKGKSILLEEDPNRSIEEFREGYKIPLDKIGMKEEIAARNRLAAVPNDLYAHDVIGTVHYDRYKRIHSRLEQIGRTNPSFLQVLDFERFKMYLDPEDRGSLYTLASYGAGSLEPFELSIFCEMVRRNPGNLFIDLGANYGLYTLHAGDLARDNLIAKVVAVEPDQRVFKKLSESVKDSGFEKTAILLNKAISDQDDEQITLFVNKGGSPDNRTFVDGGINISSQYLVNTICVDTIVSELGITGIEHNGVIIKMDIQGNEPRAFRGMKKTLSQYSSLALLFEFDPIFMEQEGFDPFEFAHEVFGAGFSDIIHVDETARLLQPLTSVDELIWDIRHYCSPHRPKSSKKYLNLLCYRNMKGPSSVNRNIMPIKVESGVSQTEIQTKFPECMVRGGLLPPTLTFEVSNRCNVSCIMCAGAYAYENTDKKGPVWWLTVEELERKLAGVEHIKSAILSGGHCEAFLNKNLTEIISILKSKKASVIVISNGTLIDRTTAEKIIFAQLDRLQISLHGATKETAESIMRRSKFEKVISNIHELIRLKEMFASTLPRITIIFVGMKRNIHELSDLVAIMGEMGVESVVLESLLERQRQGMAILKGESLVAYPELLRKEYERAKIVAERYDVHLSVNEPYKSIIADKSYRSIPKSKQKVRTSVEAGKTRFCLFPFEQPYVAISGAVSLCCSESGRSVCMGNTNDGGLDAVWNNDTYTSLRRSLLTGENLPAYCDNCERAPMVDPIVMQMEIALRQAHSKIEGAQIFVLENKHRYPEYSECIKSIGGIATNYPPKMLGEGRTAKTAEADIRVAAADVRPDKNLAWPVSNSLETSEAAVISAVEPMLDVKLRVSNVCREEAACQAQELCNYAGVLSERKEHVAALAFLDQIAIEYSAVLGDIPDLQLSRAVCLKALKRYDEAELAVMAELAVSGQRSSCYELLGNIQRQRQNEGFVCDMPVPPRPKKSPILCKLCGTESVYFERQFNKDWYACPNCSLLCYDMDESRAKVLDNGSPEGSKFPTYSAVHSREEFFCKLFLENLKLNDILLYGIGWSPVYNNLRDAGHNVVGCDLWKPLIEQRNKDFGPGAFYHRDELPNMKFDVISAFEVFEHFVRPADEVNLLVNHLKDDGIIVGCTDFWHGGSLKIHPNPDQSYWAHKSHATVWTWKSMNTLAQRFGLKTYYCKTDKRNAAAKVFFVMYKGDAFDGYVRNLPKIFYDVW